jgi:hypothetical protein
VQSYSLFSSHKSNGYTKLCLACSHVHAVESLLSLDEEKLANLVQVELEQQLRNRMDMEAELLTLMGALTDVLHQGHAEADRLAKSIRASAEQAKKVGNDTLTLCDCQIFGSHMSVSQRPIARIVAELSSCLYRLWVPVGALAFLAFFFTCIPNFQAT